MTAARSEPVDQRSDIDPVESRPVDLPKKLGSFEISGLLGEGGSAFVYAARDGDREVALKVLHPEIGLESKEVDRFLDEADRMRRVKHRALVPVIRAGLLPGGRPYIAMPRLRGSTLAATLHKGPMPLAVALPMFEDLAEGLATLHDAGLVHRDIKPENVFHLVEESRLVLLDLGIARDTASAPSTTTKAGMMRGTPAYMAPERFFGKPASVRSDLFELALVLYAMVTSKLPWDGDDPSGRLDPKPPSERGVLLPLPYNRVIMDALSVDPARRPDSVRAFMAQLRAAGPSPSVANAIGNARTELSAVTPPTALAQLNA
ncbi:MAG: serine/threonine protein kinase, partial [Myxococcales bacterium]|nr:serine/threonine protein kinase [Myxococcales bacterium]